MGCLATILLFCLPILEIYIFISVSEYTGYLTSLSSIFFSGLLGFVVLRNVLNNIADPRILDLVHFRLRQREGCLILLGLGLLIPGYLSDLLGALSLLLLPTTFLASYIRSVYRFLFSGFPKTRVSRFDSEFLQEKSKNTIIEGEYVNLSERAEDTKKKG